MIAESARSGATMGQHRISGGWSHRVREGRRGGPAGRSRIRRRAPVLERLEERLVMSSTWVQQGPGPIINGQDEGITSPDGPNPVVGAVEAVAASPTNANLAYAGAVNGGIWKTTDATDGSPIWTNLTDSSLPAQSIDS